MAGNSVSEMIFFIAAIMISSVVAVTLIEIIDDYSSDLRNEASLLKGEMSSRVTIINDPLNVPYTNSSSELVFYLKNTGTGDLSTSDIVLSANGTTAAGSDVTVNVLGGGNRWYPGVVVEASFNVTGLLEGMDYQGWVSTSGISETGQIRGHAEDTITFRIRGS
ncbi:MAG: hypothetical protein ACMUIG_02120 [Thermoplasmatota archaeon]